MNWANRLTITRIILIPVFISTVLYHRLDIALIVFSVAALTDGLDGYIARTRNERTTFGAFMDPLADKLLIDTAFICFALISGLPEYLKMPAYVPLIVISRDVIIIMGVIITYFLTSSINIKPSMIGKVTTFFQMLTIISLLVGVFYSPIIWNITVIFTVISGLDYLKKGTREINGQSR